MLVKGVVVSIKHFLEDRLLSLNLDISFTSQSNNTNLSKMVVNLQL